MEEIERTCYGFFSKEHATERFRPRKYDVPYGNRAEWYRSPSKGIVLVTYRTRDEKGSKYDWEDKVCVGLVTTFFRPENDIEVCENYRPSA